MSLPGGIREVTSAENDLEVEDLAKFAVDEHNARQNSDLEYMGIISVQKQVVAGWLYHFKLRARSAGDINIYEAKVHIKPWERFKSLVHFGKAESSFTTADLGAHIGDGSNHMGLRVVPSEDPAVKEAAKEALKHIQARSNSLIPYELKEVMQAHAEVNDEHTKFHILLNVLRGPKEEQFKAELTRTVLGEWSLKDLQQHHEGAL
ncbi:hypothetical protein KP509_04G074800 [Ceratopteris richardii]|nr:hypothetical protein KP509_04G074800 [Ceratopteris richardii]